MSYPTCRTYPRTLAQAFPDVRASWGDEVLMSRLRKIDTKGMKHDDFVSTFDTTTQPEAASAVSEFGHEHPKPRALTVTLWTRVKRALRRWWGEPSIKP